MFHLSSAAELHDASREKWNLSSSRSVELCYFVKLLTWPSSSPPMKKFINIPPLQGYICKLVAFLALSLSPLWCFINRWCILPINFRKGLEVPVLTQKPTAFTSTGFIFVLSLTSVICVFLTRPVGVIFKSVPCSVSFLCCISPATALCFWECHTTSR